MTEGVLSLHFRVIPCSSVANASFLCFFASLHFRVIPCSSVANAFFASLHFRVIPCSSVANASFWQQIPSPADYLLSFKTAPKPRIFTAKTRRPRRSSRQVWISCFPLRSLRLRGEMLLFLFSVFVRGKCFFWFSSFPCNSVFIRGKCIFFAYRR